MIMHCNSSLPRSGSELLQALLSQHPRVYASVTSPLLEFWFGAQGNYTTAEVKAQDAGEMQAAFTGFCREGASGYYSALTDRPVVIDKSRGWLEYAELLWKIFPGARIVCMTRKVDDIVGSLERIYRQHPGHPETRHLPKTPEQRAKFWTSSGSFPLGLALDRIKDRQSLGEDERIKYVDYDALVDSPVEVMREIFVHYKLNPIDVDPNNVAKSAKEDDQYFGIFGRHVVRQIVGKRDVVQPRANNYLLPASRKEMSISHQPEQSF